MISAALESSGAETPRHVIRALSGANPDIEQTAPNDRVCRVGPGNFTPSLSQIRT